MNVVSGKGNRMSEGKEMGQLGMFWAQWGKQLDGTEYRCWKEQELGSDKGGLKCQARSLAWTEQATGSPCRFLSRRMTTVWHPI